MNNISSNTIGASISTPFRDSTCILNDTHSLADEKRSTVVDLSIKPAITSSTNYQFDQLAGMLKLPFPLHAPPTLLSTSSSSSASSSRPMNSLSKPLAYCTPNPVPNLPENNQVRLLEYRGAQLAAFTVDGRDLVCLPQAFELFLKHLVGGLHTVYTKLKRLEIVPVVCNVEQVRILRGLGAIQPGVNRCKLIAPHEFDILYADCTNSSARPGRPSKRISAVTSATTTGTSNASCDSSPSVLYGCSLIEPSAKLPRKQLSEQIGSNKNANLSRSSIYPSMTSLPYVSSLAAFCLNPDTIGRLISDTEPLLQVMTNRNNPVSSPISSSSLNCGSFRASVPSNPNEYITAERQVNSNSLTSHNNHVQLPGRHDSSETRSRLHSTSEDINNRSSPFFPGNKISIPHTIRRLAGSEADQSTFRRTPSSNSIERSMNTAETTCTHSDQRELQANLSDWFKTSPILPPLKPLSDLIPGLLPIPLYEPNCSSAHSSTLNSHAGSKRNPEHWPLHSKQPSDQNSSWLELISKWKLPVPVSFPKISTEPISTQAHQETNAGFNEAVMPEKRRSQTTIESTSFETPLLPDIPQCRPTTIDSYLQRSSKEKGESAHSDEFRTCFDSMFYNILETYQQNLKNSGPTIPDPASKVGDCRLTFERMPSADLQSSHFPRNPTDSFNLVPDSQPHRTHCPNSIGEPQLMTKINDELQSNYGHLLPPVLRTEHKQDESMDQQSISVSEGDSRSPFESHIRKTNSPLEKKSQIESTDAPATYTHTSTSSQSPSQLARVPQIPEADRQYEESVSSDMSLKHFQWLHFMAKTFMFNYLPGTANTGNLESHSGDNAQMTGTKYHIE